MVRAGFVGLGSQGAGMAQRIIEQGTPADRFLDLLGHPRDRTAGGVR